MIAGGAPAVSAGGGDDVHADSVHALDNGEDLYLVFGADLEETSLQEYIDAHASGDATAEQESETEIIQHQNVDQVNINEQGEAVSISIDGGEATAVQEANQLNANAQTGEATAENDAVGSHETQFENVGNVYLVVGNGTSQQFDGWGIADKKGDKETVTQSAQANVTQSQDVAQQNYNEQSTAFAVAANDSEATAIQQTEQYNENLQEGAANASNVYVGDGEYAAQSASAWLTQEQAVDQTNVNEQGAAVAIAVGEDSTATAIQVTDQTNLNEQVGSADAANAVASMSGMNVAVAGDSSVVETETPPKDKKKTTDADDSQTATTSVDQEQAVEQLNVNLQNTAVAIATDGSEASAVQMAEQRNYNAQIGFATALNVYASPGYNYDTLTQTSSTTVTVGGDDVEDAPLSYDYDAATEQTNEVTQSATAALEQTQFVTQQNVNEQHSAVAVAEDGGSASATQVSMQENENIQFSGVAATNLWIAS